MRKAPAEEGAEQDVPSPMYRTNTTPRSTKAPLLPDRRRLPANSLNHIPKSYSRKALFSCDWICSGGGAPLPAQILAGQHRRQSPNELRFCLSHFLPRSTSLKRTGPETATRPSCGDARLVNAIRSSATGAAASRRTTSIMIGLRSVAVAALVAERPSLSSRCFLSLTRITACWRAVMRCGGALWSTAAGKRRRLRSRTLIACPTLPHSAVGRTVWSAPSWPLPFCAKRLPA